MSIRGPRIGPLLLALTVVIASLSPCLCTAKPEEGHCGGASSPETTVEARHPECACPCLGAPAVSSATLEGPANGLAAPADALTPRDDVGPLPSLHARAARRSPAPPLLAPPPIRRI